MNLSLLITAFLLLAPHDSDVSTWPAFLGQGRNAATNTDSKQPPLQWSPTSNVAWRAPLPGKGQSSPVVWGDQIFVTSMEGSMKETCWVTSISMVNGKVLWSTSIPASQTVRSNYYQARSASTPVVDADRVIALFDSGDLVAIDHQGTIQWQRSLTNEYGSFESTIGIAASLTQLDDQVFILIDHEGDSYLLAIDKATGKERWKTSRFSRSSYSSPTIVPIAGKPHIVCSSDGSIDGYDPTNGEMLWTFEEVGANRQSTPLSMGNGMFLIGASSGMNDSRVDEARESNFCMQVSLTETGYQPQILWKTGPTVMASYASPIAYQGFAYWVTKAGILHCYELQTGQLQYRQRLPCGQCWATPVLAGDRIYFFGKEGATSVIAAGKTFETLSENELWSGADDASVTPSRGRLVNRSESPMTDQQRAESRAAGANRFADQVQYGVAMVNGNLIVRSGSVVHCLRNEAK